MRSEIISIMADKIRADYEENDIKFSLAGQYRDEKPYAALSVSRNNVVTVTYFICNNDGDTVAFDEKCRDRVTEACSVINRMKGHFEFRFYVSSSGTVKAQSEYFTKAKPITAEELPMEIIAYIKIMLERNYEIFSRAIFTDEIIEEDVDMDKRLTSWLLKMEEQFEKGIIKIE